MGVKSEDGRSDPFVWVNLEFCDLDIDPISKAVYLEVARRARQKDGQGNCWESVEHIAHWANVSVATAKRSLKRLIEWGMLLRESRGGHTSLYRLTDKSDWCAPQLEKPAPKQDRGRPQKTQVKNELAQKKPSSEKTQVKNELAQKKPSSEKTQVKNELRGGSDLAQVGGSDLAHKLDPNELDPNELDPFISPLPPSDPWREGKEENRSQQSGNYADPSKPKPIEPKSAKPIDPESEPSDPIELEVIQAELLEDFSPARFPSDSEVQNEIQGSAFLSKKKKFTRSDFEEWWKHVGWKTGKQDAEKVFLEIRGIALQVLIEAIVFQQEWHIRNKGTLQYLKRPAAWLRAKAWNDEMEPIASRGFSPKEAMAAMSVNATVERLQRKFGNQ